MSENQINNICYFQYPDDLDLLLSTMNSSSNANAIKYSSIEFRTNYQVALKIVELNKNLLHYIDKSLYSDDLFVYQAIQLYPDIYSYATDQAKNIKNKIIAIILGYNSEDLHFNKKIQYFSNFLNYDSNKKNPFVSNYQTFENNTLIFTDIGGNFYTLDNIDLNITIGNLSELFFKKYGKSEILFVFYDSIYNIQNCDLLLLNILNKL